MSRLVNSGSVFSTTLPVSNYPLTFSIWWRGYSPQTPSVNHNSLLNLGASGQAADYISLCLSFDATSNTQDTLDFQVRKLSTGPFQRALVYVNSNGTFDYTDTWHHFCGTVTDSKALSVYWKGTEKNTVTTSVINYSDVGVNVLRIGARPWSAHAGTARGYLAHPAIWKAALSDSEIESLASGLSPIKVRPQDLTFYAPTFGRDASDIDIIGRIPLTTSLTTVSAEEPGVRRQIGPRLHELAWIVQQSTTTETSLILDSIIPTSQRNRIFTDSQDLIVDAALSSAQRNRFSVDLAELSDASDASILRAREALEALLLADETPLQALRARAASEDVAIDDLSILYAIRNRLSTDTISTVLDEFLSGVERSRIDSDSISTFDAALASILRVRFSDDVAELLDAFNAIITSGGPALYNITITDPLAALDFVLAQLMLIRAATDSAEIQDALITQASRARVVSEIATASDEVQRTAFRNIELIDSAILLDAEIGKVAFRNLLSSDSLASNDESLRATSRTITIAESLILSEEVARQIVRLLTSSDLIDVVEARDKVLSIVSTISELLEISEEIVKAQIFGTFFDVRVILGSALLKESIKLSADQSVMISAAKSPALSIDHGAILAAAENPKLGSYN